MALLVAIVAGDDTQTWFGSQLLYGGGVFFGTFAVLYTFVAVFWWAAHDKLAKAIPLPGTGNLEAPDEQTAAEDVQAALDDRDQWQALAEPSPVEAHVRGPRSVSCLTGSSHMTDKVRRRPLTGDQRA